MNLIDIYVSEIGRQLPQKTHADIEAEIRSALQDMLEERSKQTGKTINEELILEVLQAYGSPEKVAASYRGERSLIGPRLYPAFIKVIKIVFPIIGVLSLVGLGFSLGRTELSPGIDFHSVLQADAKLIINVISLGLTGFVSSLISALGGITLIFAILERFDPNLKTKETPWDAHTLLKISMNDHIKPVELIVEMFFAGLAVVIFNFFPQAIRFTPSLNSVIETGNWQSVYFFPFLSNAFFQYVPFLTVIWILIIVLDGILFQRGKWEIWSRWFSIVIKALGITIAIFMLLGPSLIVETMSFPFSGGGDVLHNLLNQIIRVGLVLSILFGGLDMIKLLIHLFRGKTSTLKINMGT